MPGVKLDLAKYREAAEKNEAKARRPGEVAVLRLSVRPLGIVS